LSASSLNFSQLSDQILHVLRQQIIEGKLKPGQRLSIAVLAQQLGVSATPVRDALRRLSADGLVEMIPRRGTFVSEFSRQDIRQVFQVRRILECAAAEASPHAPDRVIERLMAIVDEIGALRDEERFLEYLRYIALDTEFHQQIVDLLDNGQISDFYRQLRWPTQVVRGLSYSAYQRAQDTVAEHAAIAVALKEKEVSKAKEAILTHLNNAEADLLRRMPPELVGGDAL
jgi:DNA-binding GntR family transcriptional regulator